MTNGASFIIFSGGTACNHIARAFHDSVANDVCYVLGISDNGGSSSELLRVLGGPSIGDLRSRLTRLIDIVETGRTPERLAIKQLLSYRLPADASEQEVKEEWTAIVEGRHQLWAPIPTEKRETIRGFLTSFHCEVLKRAHKRFNFRNGSIGNFFLTGARLFFGSLEAALFLFKAITGISELTAVVPVINTNHTATIAAQLANGTTLAGQNEISHPPPAPANGSRRPVTPGCRWTHSNPIDAFSHLALGNEDESPISPEAERNSNLFFSKHVEQKLESPIERIYYINQYGQEIYPVPNPKVISQLSSKRTLIYSIGSLYTSIVPCLILRSIGNAIAHSTSLKQKILLLNGSNDRETSGYTALDFIKTITDALNQSRKIDARRAFYQSCTESELSAVASTVVSGSSSSTTTTDSGSFAGTVPSSCNSSGFAYAGSMPGTPPHNYPPFPDHQFVPDPPSSFITHLVYLENGLIPVDVDAIVALGIQCVKISGSISSTDGYPIYDESILSETIRRITEQVQ